MGTDILRGLLKDYYSRAELYLPRDFILREFAFQTFDKGVYVRHMSFQNEAVLRNYLVSNTPRQAYYSSALYRDPAAERMEEKGWLGSELMFDIDADHIAGCEKVCIDLGNGKKLELIKPSCMDLAKEHELRLLDLLKYDFGFSNSEIMVYFSGNRGFHTVVRPKDEDWMKLLSHHRREIVDYIKGIGIDPGRLSPLPKHSKRLRIDLSSIDGGWVGRLVRAGLLREGYTYDDILEGVEKLRIEIDEQVTQDISRLIRIPGSINGKAGLPAIKLEDESAIISFEYGPNISPFKGEALVRVASVPKRIEFLGVSIELSSNSVNKVPLFIAVMLAFNGLAKILRLL